MDPNHQASSPNTRKRARDNETDTQRHKREKAAERQRRKRERDRQAGLSHMMPGSQVEASAPPPEPSISLPPDSFPEEDKQDDLDPDEAARRERVRTAARERQRKHRALAKQKKLRELGLDMGNELMPGMDELQYRINENGQYQQLLPHEMQHHPHVVAEPPFPQGPPLGGQTFASTLLLSFSCAPLLKAHLLRTLNMSNEELASLEPIIAQAWDHWDQQRRMQHYAQNPAGAPKPPDGSGGMQDSASHYATAMNVAAAVAAQHAANPYGVHDPSQGPPNDFRARFHRPLVAPFGGVIDDPQQQGVSVGPSSSANHGQVQQTESLEPGTTSLDPQLGQARDEAVGVAGKLARE